MWNINLISDNEHMVVSQLNHTLLIHFQEIILKE